MTVERVRQALEYFEPGVVRLNPPVGPREVTRAEVVLGVSFPPAFRRALSEFNGGYVVDRPVFGIPPVHSALDLVRGTRQARHLWGALGWSEAYAQVGSDGCGNLFVLLLDRQDEHGESPVGFFDTGCMEVTEVVASTYLHFLWFLAQDAQWEYASDGRPIPREAVVWTAETVVVRPTALSPWRFNEAWMFAHDPILARWR